MRRVLTRNQIFWTKLRSFKCILNIYNQQPQVHLRFLTNESAKFSNFVTWREGEAKTYQKKREFLKELGSSESMRFINIWPSLIFFKWNIKTVDSWLNSRATSRTLKSLRSHLRAMYYFIKTLMKLSLFQRPLRKKSFFTNFGYEEIKCHPKRYIFPSRNGFWPWMKLWKRQSRCLT